MKWISHVQCRLDIKCHNLLDPQQIPTDVKKKGQFN